MTKTKKDTDLSLVLRVKQGDLRAYDLLVKKYQSRLLSLAYKYVSEISSAEDIVQESFIKAYKSIKSFRQDSSFYTWIYRITSNTAINYISSKTKKNEKSFSEFNTLDIGERFEELSTESGLENIFEEELITKIDNILSSLPQETKNAFLMREYEGKTYEEIAQIIDCPIGTVRSRIFRAREILSNELEPFLYEKDNKQVN
tara:strand:- start:37006 stop:37608 length:603 start_codon:yes stop_codon:yes gene_type:complete